jgi:hypothetical protein
VAYVLQLQRFAAPLGEYLYRITPPRKLFVLMHNAPLLAGLGVLFVAGVLLRRDPDAPRSEAGPALGLALCWLVLPQVVTLAFGYTLRQPVVTTRYLCYVTPGGALVLAWLAVRHSRRIVMTMAAGLAILFVGMTPWGQGEALVTSRFPWHQVQALSALDDAGDWRPGDVLLQRAGFLEGDLRHLIPEPQRRHVEGVLAAPYSTLYVAAKRRPCIVLSLSERHGVQIATSAGSGYDPCNFYTADLAQQLREHRRFWIGSHDWDRDEYLACVLPWLAEALGQEMSVQREARPGAATLVVRPGDAPAVTAGAFRKLTLVQPTPADAVAEK